MKSFAWYDLQVIICSAIMMSYYFLVLRNKKFHQYNRFYILAVFFLSFIIPLVKIQLDKMNADNTAVQFIYVLADYNASIDKAVAGKGFQLSWDMMAIISYAAVSAFFLFTFIVALVRIKKLLRQFDCKSLGEIYLIFTNVKGTPFSFFKYIFWNEEIDLQSSTGQQILQHELTHVKEKHSVDNIIIQVLMIFGWFNPFFWLARKELQMIHEFIADKKSVDNGDASSLAEMLLAATYPQQQFLLTNSFFFSPIKRRLLMITQNKNPRFSYLRRVVVLPLMAVVVLLFAFRMKEQNAKNNLADMQSAFSDTTQNPSGAGVSQAELDEYEAILKSLIIPRTLKNGKTIQAIDGSKQVETKRAYEIWQAMSALQREKSTQISFTKLPPAKRKVPSASQYEKWKNENQYGVWIDDKHVSNSSLNNYKSSDFDLYYESNLTGAAKTGKKYNVQVSLCTKDYFKTKMRKDTSIFVVPKRPLKSIDSLKVVPLSASKALMFVDGKKITHDEMGKINPNNIESMSVLKDKIATDKYGNEGKNGVIEIKMKAPKPLYVLNGKLMPKNFDFSKISTGDIASVNVLKDAIAIYKYGDDGKNGVIEITTKPTLNTDNSGYQVFLERNKDVKSCSWKYNPRMTIIIELKNGTSETYDLSNESSEKRAIDKYGALPIAPPPPPSGRPVVTNVPRNHTVDVNENYDKIFTQTQVPAEFPGGKEAWQKYLERNLNRDLPVEKGAGPGKYAVELSFIVDDKGMVSKVKADNDPGYGTAEEAVRFMRKGPNWKPAVQNGRNVTSLVKQTITFVVSEE